MPAPVVAVERPPWRFVRPRLGDPRLHQSAVLLSLQVLGQTVLGWRLSIAQLLVALGTAGLIEAFVVARRDRLVAWPASALLTGNGVALILRVPGTEHGDWWSLRGWWAFAGIAALSIASKHLLRWRGRHVFNPSNLGLVVGFLVLGPARVDPQVLWWGDLDVGLAAAIALILLGGVTIVGRLGLLAVAMAFWATFAALVGLLTASGHCMTAAWHVGPVCGGTFWWTVVLSPELFVFAMFMITDPRTTPAGPRARLAFGVAVGALAALAVAPQRTEFATKVAILAALTVVTAAVPVVRVARARVALARPVRRGPVPALAALGGVAVLLAGVPLAGGGARPERFVARDLTLDGAAAPVLPAGFPAVVLGPTSLERAPWYTQATAEQRALDLVADLDVLADALERRDLALARTAARDDALRTVTASIEEAAATGRVTVDRYRLERITTVMVRIPRNVQPSPEVGFELTGVRVRTALDLSTSPPTVRSVVEEPVVELVRLRPPDDDLGVTRYLLAGPGEVWLESFGR